MENLDSAFAEKTVPADLVQIPWQSNQGMLIPLSRQVNFMELHLSVTHEFIEGVELVGIEIKNFFDPGVHQNLKTVDAGSVGNVDRRILYARPVLGGLRDRVHFSVDGAKTVLFSVAVGCFRFVN